MRLYAKDTLVLCTSTTNPLLNPTDRRAYSSLDLHLNIFGNLQELTQIKSPRVSKADDAPPGAILVTFEIALECPG